MNKEQYNLLKKGFKYLKIAHKEQDINFLNKGADIVSRFEHFKDFDVVSKFIVDKIGGL